jgi:hypothetical protein
VFCILVKIYRARLSFCALDAVNKAKKSCQTSESGNLLIFEFVPYFSTPIVPSDEMLSAENFRLLELLLL